MSGGAAMRRGRAILAAVALAAFPQVARPQVFAGGPETARGGPAVAGAEQLAGGQELRATGRSLSVEAACAAAVELREDAFLLHAGEAGQVVLEAEAGGSGAALSSADGVVRVAVGCGHGQERVVLRVSPGLAVRLAGTAKWHVGAMGGEVEATLHGDGEAAFGALRVLRLVQDGSGDVRVASVSERLEATLGGDGDLWVGEASGAAVLRVAGSGDIAVGSVSLAALEVAGSGGGDVSVGAGRVGQVTAMLSGGSNLHLAAAVRDARLVASGGSDIGVARVEGSLSQAATGGSSITVREPPAGAGAVPGEAGVPPLPPMPPLPAMPQMPAMPFGISAPGPVRAPGWLTPGLVWVGVLVAAGVAVRARAARRRRPASLRDGWGRADTGRARRPGETAAPASAAQAWSRDPDVAVLQQRLAAVEARVAQAERAVTSPEFELHRGFRDLAG